MQPREISTLLKKDYCGSWGYSWWNTKRWDLCFISSHSLLVVLRSETTVLDDCVGNDGSGDTGASMSNEELRGWVAKSIDLFRCNIQRWLKIDWIEGRLRGFYYKIIAMRDLQSSDTHSSYFSYWLERIALHFS
jgi:hypothetical protein